MQTKKKVQQLELSIQPDIDEFDRRFPLLARRIYFTYRYGFRAMREALLEKIAESADTGELDKYLKD